ncbi:MAG: hypothetical protein E6G26_12165 [Actinobacteria bacterium]|nr:MAG: hypothetical protein E6G26_12165 [Actinomycetota bacterium]
MTELERALIALGDELEFPPAPDAWPRVAERLQRRRWIRPAVFALAAGVLAFGIALAVPPARSAILKFFHIGSVSVERVETLPPAQTQPFATGLGPARAAPTLKLPARLTATKYYKGPGMAAALLRYRGRQLLLAELRGDQMGFSKKFVGPTTHIEEVPLGEFGLWLSGAPHVLVWQFGNVQTRLAGNVLLWLQSGVTYRLEGQLTKGQMLALARQITP